MYKKVILLTCVVALLGVVGSASGQVGKGNILFEYWFNHTGANISDLTSIPDYPDNPDDSEWRTSFEGPLDTWENYGERARGYLYPPETGDYSFWIATDDAGELWLSTDDDPADAVRIAWIDGWCPSRDWLNTGGTDNPDQDSAPIHLVAGQKYYIEARMKEAGGGDNLSVAWGGPGIGAGPVLIAGSYLSPVIRPIDVMASNPSPPDGATGWTSPALMWTAGQTAKFHEVYLGTSPDLGPADLVTTPYWQHNMYWHLPGFTAGVTYYWRVDEVEADGTTTHVGDIWSFTAAPLTAYNPDPPDGTRNMPTDVVLSWSPGTTAFSHDVYFGTDETAVTNGTGGTFKGNQDTTSYDPGTLTEDTRYYWRIDDVEQNTTTKHPGDVWNFKTIPNIPINDPDLMGWWKFDEGYGTTAIDWSGHGNHATLMGDPQWVDGYDGGALEFDGDGDYVDCGNSPDLQITDAISIMCWIKVNPWTKGWETIMAKGDDSYRLSRSGSGNATHMGIGGTTADPSYFDATVVVTNNEWRHVAATYDGANAKIYVDGVLDTTYPSTGQINNSSYSLYIGENSQATGRHITGLIDDVRVYKKALTVAELEAAMRGDPTLAWNPNPINDSTPDIEHAEQLTWTPGEEAAKHDVYFGTDRDAVEDADTTATGIYRGRIDPNSYTPPEGVQANETYYWRIDEFNTDATISEGRIWSFTVADYLVIDDFDAYDDYCNRVFYTWPDGWGHNGDLACGVPPYGGNGTGSTVGYLSEPYAEQTITHDGSFQSMPFEYLNDGSTGKAFYSETQREFQSPQDFTRKGMKSLTLWFQGEPGSVGSFNYDPVTDVYTMTADGWDISGTADGFHYAFKQLSGVGSIQAQMLGVANTSGWAKAGVMIREDLDPNSAHAMTFVTPGNGVVFEYRPLKGVDNVDAAGQDAVITAPHWVRISRSGNTFSAEHSADGITWQTLGTPQNIPMASTVYVGLELSSGNTALTCEAAFSDVTITGTVTGQWQSQDIGITSNDAEQLYMALEDSTGTVQDVPHPDPNAVQLDTWQQWNIDLADFAPVDLTKVKKVYIGVGDRNAPKLGGGGMLYIDDIRLYAPRCFPSLARPAGDFNNDCVVGYPDLVIMTDNWLATTYDVVPIAPSTAGLISHYTLDGNTNDSVGGNHGTKMGVGPAAYSAGMDGQAINLDGLDDYVDCGANPVFNINTNITVACWIKARDLNRTWQAIVTQGDNSWRLHRSGNSDNVAWGTSGLSPLDITGTVNINDGQWHHVAGVYDGAQKRLYIDGNLDVSSDSTGNINNSDYNVNIGENAQATGRYWDGLIDDVRIYNVALSQAEVASLAGKTATFTQPLHMLLSPPDPAMDMNSDDVINLKDYALLADTWLDEILWP